MYYLVVSRKHTFKHNTGCNVVASIAISPHRVFLFFSSGKYFEYDLKQNKILNSFVTEKPLRLALLNKSQILTLTESRKLTILDVSRNLLTDVCKLPNILTGNEHKDKNTFLSTQICPLIGSNTFYIKEIIEQDNRTRLVYFTQNCEVCQIMEFPSINLVIESVNEHSLVAVYKPFTEPEKKWEMRMIDLSNNFQERKYIVEHKSLSSTAVVVKTYMKDDNELMIFLNGHNPEVLILNLERGDIREMELRLQMNFIDVAFCDRESGVMGLYYLGYSKSGEESHENLLEVVDILSGKSIEKEHITVGNPSVSLNKKFILDLPRKSPTANPLTFHTRHLFKKKSLYFHVLRKSHIFESFGQGICSMVLRLLDK